MGKIKIAYGNISLLFKQKAQERFLERKQIKYAQKEIRKKAITAGLKEREKQAIKYAREKQKVFSEKRIKQLRQSIKQQSLNMDDLIMNM